MNAVEIKTEIHQKYHFFFMHAFMSVVFSFKFLNVKQSVN